MINKIHKKAIQKLEDSSMYYLASILKRMSIQEVQTNEIAYVLNSGGATIFVGQGFKKLKPEEQENTLIHEAMHIPQINAAGELEPYYDFDKAFVKTDDEEFIKKTGEKYEKWRNICDNIGMDAEINEFITKYIGKLPKGVVMPNTMQEHCQTDRTNPNDGLEFFDYVQYAIDEVPIPEDEEQQDNSSQDQSTGESETMRVSDLNPNNWGQVAQGIIDRAEQEVLQKMDSSISYEGGDIGLIKGLDTVKLKKGIIPAGIVKELNTIKNKMRPRYMEGETPEYKWGRINKAFPGKDFPGMKKVKTKKNVKKAVVVLDSSGSMWDERMFKTLIAIAHWFNDKKILAGLYCCDTELSKCELSSSWGEVRGGGGTEFGSRHVSQIVSDVGQEIDIVYITDGELDLTEAKKSKDVHLVIVRS